MDSLRSPALVGVSVPDAPFCAARPVAWGGIVARVRASVRARKAVPTSLALAGVDVLAHLRLRLSKRRMSDAVAIMDSICGGLVPEADIPRLARRRVAAAARGRELVWRPWELERVPIQGADRLVRARDAGRGLVVCFPHLGPLGASMSLARVLRPTPLYAPVGPWAAVPPKPGWEGYCGEQRLAVLRGSVHLIDATGAARTLLRVLKGGGALLIATDVRGNRETQFLGKPVEMTDGPSRLATMADSLVVVGALMPSGRRWRMEFVEALDPQDFPSSAELHLEIVRIQESMILRALDHYSGPARPHGTGWDEASRHGWYVKSPSPSSSAG